MNRHSTRVYARLGTLSILLTLLLTLGGCFWPRGGMGNIRRATRLSREMKHETFSPPEAGGPYEIVLENLAFINTDNVDIDIIPSDETRVEVDYSASLDRYGFAVTFDENELRIGTENARTFSTSEFVMTIYAPYDRITLSGGMPLKVDANGLDSLQIDVRGASDIKVQALDAEEVVIDLDGAGAFDLTGRTEHLSVSLDGAGSVDARQLMSSTADVSIAGAGSIQLSVSDILDAAIDGIGSIDYYGSPEVNRSGSGLGSLQQAGSGPWGD